MAKEIERKFLVADERWRAEVAGTERLRQGYLFSDARTAVRVRTAGAKAFLTIKGEISPVERDEFEYEIPVADAERMLDGLCRGGLVDKTRHTLRRAGGHWTVDVFEGANAGLVVVEVELAAVTDSPPLPAWIGREVTDDPRYRNAALSKRPFTTW
jgi:adenylate cyclase